MSAIAEAPAPAAGHHEPSKFHYFIAIAMILAVITGVEVVLVYLPLVKWFVVTTLCILSAVKFMFVIFIFMHLRWDKVFLHDPVLHRLGPGRRHDVGPPPPLRRGRRQAAQLDRRYDPVLSQPSLLQAATRVARFFVPPLPRHPDPQRRVHSAQMIDCSRPSWKSFAAAQDDVLEGWRILCLFCGHSRSTAFPRSL